MLIWNRAYPRFEALPLGYQKLHWGWPMLHPSTSSGADSTIISEPPQSLWNIPVEWRFLVVVVPDHQDVGQTGKLSLYKMWWNSYQLTAESSREILSSNLWPSGCLPTKHTCPRWRANFTGLWITILPHPSGWGLKSSSGASPQVLYCTWCGSPLDYQEIIHPTSATAGT